MLLAVNPLALVFSAIWICVNTKPMLFVITIFTFIAATIWPSIFTFAMKLILLPGSFIRSTVRPLINSISFYLVAVPLAIVISAVCPGILTSALFVAVSEVASILRTIFQRLDAFAVLDIVYPVTLILLSSFVSVGTFPVRFVLIKRAFESVAICMIKYTKAISLPHPPISCVPSLIRPNCTSMSMLQIVKFRNLSGIPRSIRQQHIHNIIHISRPHTLQNNKRVGVRSLDEREVILLS